MLRNWEEKVPKPLWKLSTQTDQEKLPKIAKADSCQVQLQDCAKKHKFLIMVAKWCE